MEDCLACELLDGRRPSPGGRIDETERWVVDHCVGPLGVGTLAPDPRTPRPAARFDAGELPDPAAIEVAADRLRVVLAGDRG
jgi:hypothetical protein